MLPDWADNKSLHPSREVGCNKMENHLSRPGELKLCLATKGWRMVFHVPLNMKWDPVRLADALMRHNIQAIVEGDR